MSKVFESYKTIIKDNKKKFILFIIFSLIVVLIDQGSKWLAIKYLGPLTESSSNGDLPSQYGSSIVVIKGFLNFSLLTNNGAAFGLGGNLIISRIIFIIISWAVFFGLIIYLFSYLKKGNKFSNLILLISILIYGGNLGNLIDRTFYWSNPCGVIDFIDISPLIKGFGVFNIADSALVVGILILFIYLIVEIFKGNNEETSKPVEDKNDKTSN